MSVEFDRESPGEIDSKTLNRKTLSRWTGRNSDWMDSMYKLLSTHHDTGLSHCNCSPISSYILNRRTGPNTTNPGPAA